MQVDLDIHTLMTLGLNKKDATFFIEQFNAAVVHFQSKTALWQYLSKNFLSDYSFAIHLYLFQLLFPQSLHETRAPVWFPDEETIKHAHLTTWMNDLNLKNVPEFHQWTINHYDLFLHRIIAALEIQFKEAPQAMYDLSQGIEMPQWFPHARMNIADSCLMANPDNIAIYQFDAVQNKIQTISFHTLEKFVNRIANSLIQQGYQPHDRIAIIMPFHWQAAAIFLAIIKMGGVVVSIADSFSAQEIATRLRISKTKLVFTQDTMTWNEKTFVLYEKVCKANSPKNIVLREDKQHHLSLREEDMDWKDFLNTNENCISYSASPMDVCQILFSSGTTGDPKAIPWNHTTGIKAAIDAYFHQDIHAQDVLCWPTNLGWMMGPWLIYAAFINRAAIALYPGLAKSRSFGEFIQDAKITMLGVVPTLVRAWRESRCMENLNWETIRTFSSTGECSNAEDMFYLMSLANYKPIIEYCGGTEIGGAYVSSTVIEENYPALFSTEVMGMQFVILNAAGEINNEGEVAILPPALGLSTELLNANHHDVYFKNMPEYQGITLRKHGDQIRRLPNGYYEILGRADDTMNLGGIKVSAAEIERVLSHVPYVLETAAVAVSHFGPSQLMIYAVCTNDTVDVSHLKKLMQEKMNQELNPLFKIHEVVIVKELPKTASNKIMRRLLRK